MKTDKTNKQTINSVPGECIKHLWLLEKNEIKSRKKLKV